MRTFFNLFRVLVLIFLSLNLPVAAEGHRGEKHSRPVVDEPSQYDLKMYLEVLDAREKTLQAINDHLLNEAQYGLIKIPLFMGRAALDGYFFSRILGVGKAMTASAAQGATAAASYGIHKGLSNRALAWLSAGGLEKLKSLGFNLGIIAVSAANNTYLLPGFRWQYGVPIYGTAYAAYLWSSQLMSASDVIEQNGNEIIKIRKEKAKVKAILEKTL